MSNIPELLENFTAKAELVTAKVYDAPSKGAALQYIVDVCAAKNACEMLVDEPDAEKGPLGPNNVPTRVKRIVAAPDLSDEDFAALAKLCEEKGFLCIKEGLHKHLAGIDVGVNTAICGIAASGTCMLNCNKEDIRLASMVSEVSILLLRKADIRPDLPATVDILRAQQSEGNVACTTYITGPSRTADIERVPAVGVHGPLELHVILED